MSFTPPTNGDLIARYPAFAAVSTTTIDYWLAQAVIEIEDNWPESTRANAQMAWAAHRMVEIGVAGITGINGGGGVSSFRSGSFSATLTDEAANRTGFDATVYGREFVQLRNRSFAGPRVY